MISFTFFLSVNNSNIFYSKIKSSQQKIELMNTGNFINYVENTCESSKWSFKNE